MTNMEDTAQSFEEDVVLRHQLPISKIKKICKLDPLLNSISAEAVLLVTLAAEKYAKLLGSAAYSYAKDENRKTIQMKDIDRCIKKDWLFAILEDAISDCRKLSQSVQENSPTSAKGSVSCSFRRSKGSVEYPEAQHREKVNDNLLKFSSTSMPKYDQDDIQLLLGGEPGEMMVEVAPDAKASMQQDQSQDSGDAMLSKKRWSGRYFNKRHS
uniref:Transcription factor CBF/NF-Y/archaeal histone domain-containing protein n=1 Tax=Ditylenchus dipsaci TaxID=166011 RepID=A0A915ECI0_9BILA